jgi:hypothetical protein
MQQCQVGWNIPLSLLFLALIQINGACKMLGFKPKTSLILKSSALTTRPRLLALYLEKCLVCFLGSKFCFLVEKPHCIKTMGGNQFLF